MATYYHYGDSLSSQTISWTEIIKNENVKPIEEIEQKQFGDILITHDSKSIPLDTLDSLLIQYGIDPSANNDLKQELSMQQKIDLLLKISSPDFWRKNYELHPKHSRIKTWISVHKRYLRQIKRISEISKPNKLKKAFVKYINKIKSHTEYEEFTLFKFIKENIKLENNDLLNIFEKEHKRIEEISNHILELIEKDNGDNPCVDNGECKERISDLWKVYQNLMNEHFMKEEQHIVNIMLNINNEQYRTYRWYLSWKYYFMY